MLPDALATMRRELRRRRGAVPELIGGGAVEPGYNCLSGEEFLLRTEDGLALYYRKGAGVTIDGPTEIDPRELDLWLNGTLYAAVAAINGLLPIHASAVAHRGKVYAFNGPSGAGKSTLAAALMQRGFTLYCDDTLVLDPAGVPPLCLPGHKRLKLWPTGVELSGVAAQEQVAASYPKLFVSEAGAETGEMLPLGGLVYLEDGQGISIEPVRGAERLTRLADDHYTAELHEQANRMDRIARFEFQAALARSIPAWRLSRPFDPEKFGDMVERVADWIEEAAGA